MKLIDIPQTTKLNIMLSFEDQEYHIEASVLAKFEDGLLITPLKIDDTTINFCNNAMFEYYEQSTNDKHVFHLSSINRICFSDSEFHVIKGKDMIECSNGRRAQRYNVQLRGTAKLENKQTMNIMVNDISLRGISFITGSNSYKLPIGETIELSFFKYKAYKRVTVNCKVVRSFSLNGFTAYGCELFDISSEITQFIREKISEKNYIIEMHQCAQ